MENPFPSKEQGDTLWASIGAQAAAASPDCDHCSSNNNNNNNNLSSDMMNFDSYAGWCCSPSSATDQMLAYSSYATYSPFDGFNFTTEQSPAGFSVADGDGDLSYSNSGGDNKMMMFQPPHGNDTQFGLPMDFDDSGDVRKQKNVPAAGGGCSSSSIPRPLSQTLSEKMLKALSLFKESSGGAILAQVWVPIKHGDQCFLSTCEQPYLLDQMLAGYREVSRAFTFSAEVKPGSFPGLPGRVFISKVPEWTSNVVYYNKAEYLRVQHAVAHEVRGSIALPVFEDNNNRDGMMPCCAVLELVTMREKPNFDSEIENVCRALQVMILP